MATSAWSPSGDVVPADLQLGRVQRDARHHPGAAPPRRHAGRAHRPRRLLAGRRATSSLSCAVDKEACTLDLAPTASTTAQMAMGDALAVALLDARGFREEDFALSHPGGALGRKLLMHVADLMRNGDAVPRVARDAVLLDAAAGDVAQGPGPHGGRRRQYAGGHLHRRRPAPPDRDRRRPAPARRARGDAPAPAPDPRRARWPSTPPT